MRRMQRADDHGEGLPARSVLLSAGQFADLSRFYELHRISLGTNRRRYASAEARLADLGVGMSNTLHELRPRVIGLIAAASLMLGIVVATQPSAQAAPTHKPRQARRLRRLEQPSVGARSDSTLSACMA